MISYLLFNKILQLAVIMLFGFLLVKLKVIKSCDSTVLSKISLYLLMPAALLNAFDVEVTPQVVKGLALSFGAGISLHFILLGMDWLYKKIFKGTEVERASVMYSNAANLIIPLVSYVLGGEWVIYCCAFMSVQIVFLWTHAIRLFSSQKLDIKKIVFNTNIIAIVVGVILLLSGLRLPAFVKEITSSLGSMIGAMGMLIAGMLATTVNLKQTLVNKRFYLVVAMRMLVYPVVMLCILKCVLWVINFADADKILLVSYLASITPPAATIMQFAQINNKDADFAVAVNIESTILCIATMPLFVWCFGL